MERGRRGRPLGSKNKKKHHESHSQRGATPFQLRTSSSLTQLTASDYEVSDDDVSVNTGLQGLDSAIQNITTELKNIRSEFAKSLEEHAKLISSLKKENSILSKKVEEKKQSDHDQSLNKLERHSRRNNFRIVGVKEERAEDCLRITTDILEKMGLPSPKLEKGS